MDVGVNEWWSGSMFHQPYRVQCRGTSIYIPRGKYTGVWKLLNNKSEQYEVSNNASTLND